MTDAARLSDVDRRLARAIAILLAAADAADAAERDEEAHEDEHHKGGTE